MSATERDQSQGTVRVDTQGRVVLPRQVRSLLQLEPGATLHYRASADGHLDLRTREAIIAEIRSIAAPLREAGYGVSQFLAEKSEEADREEEEVEQWLRQSR